MTQDQSEELIQRAVAEVIANDAELLRLDVTERALSHQVARYMAPLVAPPLAVDCEYNRHGADPKRLHLLDQLQERQATDRDLEAVIVFPDIIVHRRGTDDQNMLVVELKKPHASLDYDRRKLRAFRKELRYRHAAHLVFGYDRHGNLIQEVLWDVG